MGIFCSRGRSSRADTSPDSGSHLSHPPLPSFRRCIPWRSRCLPIVSLKQLHHRIDPCGLPVRKEAIRPEETLCAPAVKESKAGQTSQQSCIQLQSQKLRIHRHPGQKGKSAFDQKAPFMSNLQKQFMRIENLVWVRYSPEKQSAKAFFR